MNILPRNIPMKDVAKQIIKNFIKKTVNETCGKCSGEIENDKVPAHLSEDSNEEDIKDLEILLANPDPSRAKDYGSVEKYKDMLKSKIEKLKKGINEDMVYDDAVTKLFQKSIREDKSNFISKKELLKIIREVVVSEMFSSVDMFSRVGAMTLDKFIEKETGEVVSEADMLGATTKVLPSDELQSYLGRTVAGEKEKLDKYKMPYIHRGNIEIKNENDQTYDLAKLKASISHRPSKILKQNEKITHSGGGSTIYFNIGLPALKGLAVNEKTGEFVVVDTCPGAGACKVYCYAKKGGYVQWKASSMSQTRQLNFLLNDPSGYKVKLESEIRDAVVKFGEKGTKVVVRWHDAGDFFSSDYLDLAYSVARDFPDVDFYAYTKIAGVASGSKTDNFKINFSSGATPSQEKQIDLQSTKHSIVIPKQMFTDYILKDDDGKLIKVNGKMAFKSDEAIAELKNKLSMKYGVPKDTILTYDEMLKVPENKIDAPKWNVIVKSGDGDDSANRSDVIGTWLLIH